MRKCGLCDCGAADPLRGRSGLLVGSALFRAILSGLVVASDVLRAGVVRVIILDAGLITASAALIVAAAVGLVVRDLGALRCGIGILC